MEKFLYSPADLSSIMNININTVYRNLKNGTYCEIFVYCKLGGKYFITKDSVDNFLYGSKGFKFSPASQTMCA